MKYKENAETIIGNGLAQLAVVLKGRHKLALACACGEDVGCVIVAPSVDKVLIVAREHSRVPSLLVGKACGLAILVRHVHLSVGSA